MSLIPDRYKRPTQTGPDKTYRDWDHSCNIEHRVRDYRHYHDIIRHRKRVTLAVGSKEVLVPFNNFKSVNLRSLDAFLFDKGNRVKVKLRIRTNGVVVRVDTPFNEDKYIDLRYITTCLGAI